MGGSGGWVVEVEAEGLRLRVCERGGLVTAKGHKRGREREREREVRLTSFKKNREHSVPLKQITPATNVARAYG